MLVGVDIGGTFTDLVLNRDGVLSIHKLPSTPANPASAMLEGLAHITDGAIDHLESVVHGSTVATNAILERKGIKTAFITTQGLRDILLIGRQNRPVLYELQPKLPQPLIPRELCFEVPERLDYLGNILVDLDLKALDGVIQQLKAEDVQSVAVCLLYSFKNPHHEQMIRDRIVQQGLLKPWQVALSSEVLPEIREYERASTVALEAFVRPVMSRYIDLLEDELRRHNPSIQLNIMKSDGGVIGAATVRQQAIQTALSGPAAGVIGAHYIAQIAGFDRIITLDMGGTSTDVSIVPGAPVHRPPSEIDNLPLRIRLLDIDTIGAGGGSIARVDAGGALRVGPQSAGADPGPIVYGRGGKAPTVSDANAVLGLLDKEHFLGGKMPLNLPVAEAALRDLGRQIGLSMEEAALGVIEVANTNIDQALRRVSVARGYDPRDFTLVVFGGAGGLHACALADRLQISRILIPRHPGVLCAFGLLVADVILDFTRSVLRIVAPDSMIELAAILEGMLIEARDALKAEGVERHDRHLFATFDMRYVGQAFELNVPATADHNLINVFHAAHEHAYGHSLLNRDVEIVNIRVQAVGIIQKPSPEEAELSSQDAKTARIGQKSTTHYGDIALYQREQMRPGMTIKGTALMFQLDSTIFIPAHWNARIDRYFNLILEIET